MKKQALIFLISGIAVLYSVAFKEKSVSMKAADLGKTIEIRFDIKPGFGIQKMGPHNISVFEITGGYEKNKSPGDIITKNGKKILELKQVKLSGTTAKEDNEYFSAVQPYAIPMQSAKTLGIKAQIYYCSFKDSFCSMEVVQTILPR